MARLGIVLLVFAALVAATQLRSRGNPATDSSQKGDQPMTPDPADHALPKTDAQWRRVLTPEQYRVTRHKGTEAPFSGEYYKSDAQGVYRCVCCGEPLFSSDTKFDAHCGWPSFSKPIDSEHVKFVADHSHGMHRIEVQCRKCGAHLGHVFDDGPQPTGQRFCINSVSLKLEPKAAAAASQPGAASTGGAASK